MEEVEEEGQRLKTFSADVEQQNQTATIKQYLGTPSKHCGAEDMMETLTRLTSSELGKLGSLLCTYIIIIFIASTCGTDIITETAAVANSPPAKYPHTGDLWKPLPSLTQGG